MYQELTAPTSGTYLYAIYAAADRAGGLVGVDLNGTAIVWRDVDPGPFGDYHLYTMTFEANGGDRIRIWMYSPASPGYVVIDDATLSLVKSQARYLPVDLGTLGGSWSYAVALNERGRVIGDSATGDDAAVHAFSWTDTWHRIQRLARRRPQSGAESAFCRPAMIREPDCRTPTPERPGQWYRRRMLS